jgi:uncharacterized protein YkwD
MTNTAQRTCNHLFIVMGLSIVLTACGGGGSDSTSSSNTSGTVGTTPSSEVNTTPANTTPPASTSSGTPTAQGASQVCNIPGLQQAALDAINARRAQATTCKRSDGSLENAPAVASVVWNSPLFQAAERHSFDMANQSFFSHLGSDGTRVYDDNSSGRLVTGRATAAGYRYSFVGENIAAGYGALNEAIAGWMDSTSGHCQLIMQANARDMGLSCVSREQDPQRYRVYWTLVVGCNVSPYTSCPRPR